MDCLKNRGQVFWMAGLLFVLAASHARADDQAYFIGWGQFGTIDLNTGVVTTLGSNTLSNFAAGLGQLGGTLYTAAQNGGTLYTVNPASGGLNAVGNSSIIYLALGSTTTGLYAAGWPAGTNINTNPPLFFYSIDPLTAAARQIGQFGVGPGFYGRTFSTGSPTLYFADFENLYSIDTNSGNATVIGGTSGQILYGLTLDNGKLYAVQDSPDLIYTLDPASGAATTVANYATSATINGLAPITPPVTQQVLPQLAFGGGWYTSLYFTNLGASQASFTINFVTGTGAPLTIPALNGSSTIVNLAPRASTVIQIPNTGSLVEGYVTAGLPAGVTGYGVFGYTAPGAPASQEAVVPLSGVTATTSSLIFDETSYTTGVAVVSLGSSAATVNVTAYNMQGGLLGTGSLPLAVNGKTAIVLRDIPGLSGVAGQLGSVDFSVTSGNVAALGIRYNGQAFTSIPTSAGTVMLGLPK